jgi:hypothetical protein
VTVWEAVFLLGLIVAGTALACIAICAAWLIVVALHDPLAEWLLRRDMAREQRDLEVPPGA